jgi:hypothetical protein
MKKPKNKKMKNKILSLITVLTISTVCFGQTSNLGSFSKLANNQNGRVVYTQDSLFKMNKLDLTKIYLEQVQSLNNILPYASFNIKGQASGVKQIDIPKSKYTNSKRTKVSTKAQNYNETVNENLNEIIPYSDKNEIIKGILFVQEMINRLDQGL